MAEQPIDVEKVVREVLARLGAAPAGSLWELPAGRLRRRWSMARSRVRLISIGRVMPKPPGWRSAAREERSAGGDCQRLCSRQIVRSPIPDSSAIASQSDGLITCLYRLRISDRAQVASGSSSMGRPTPAGAP